ncbi:MAG: hypothetical protein JSV44_11750 [Candidatus Zixiibacteriota bacterium]|nr:MAG: hypothetical protein JSV44_11750 [candidate division Zixibacteria bacterium]
MSLRINNNIAAINSHRNLVLTTMNLSQSMEKLSSGYRINRAADDPAGLVISEQFRAQIGGLNQAIENSEGSINMIQTAEGALTELNALLVSMRELAIHAANEGFNDTAQLEADQAEIDNAILTIDRIAANTQFGTKKLLDGSNANTAVFTGDTAGASGMNIRESNLSDGEHYITASKVSESAATLNSEIYGVSINSAVTPTNLSDGIHNLDVIQSAAGALKNNGSSLPVLDEWGNGITLGAVAIEALIAASAGGAAAAATSDNSGTYNIGLSYQSAGSSATEAITISATVVASAAATVGLAALVTKLNNAINSTALDGSVKATISAGGTIQFKTLGIGANHSVSIESFSTDAITSWFTFAASQSARGASINQLRFEVISADSYGMSATITATVALIAQTYTTAGDILTEINDKLDDALGIGFGEAEPGVANITASLGGPNTNRLDFALADQGSAYSIRALATNLDGEEEANYALGIALDNVAITGTDGILRLDGYATMIDRVDWADPRDIIIANKDEGEDVRGTLGLTIATAKSGGLTISNMLLDVDAARFAVYLDGSTANTVIAGLDSTVYNSGRTESLTINIDLDALGGTETINNTDQSLVFQIGANVGQTVKIGLRNMSSWMLGQYIPDNMFVSLAQINVTTVQGAQDSQAIIDAAIDEVSQARGTLGSFQKNTLESNLRNLRIASQNLQSSESNIRDTDMAQEMSQFVKNQILMQAGTAMLAQANQVPQVVLSLFG